MKRKESKNTLSRNSKLANLAKGGNLLFETIKIQNRQLQNIAWHNQRFNQTLFELFGVEEKILLENQIQIPKGIDNGIFKCHVIYSREIEKIEFEKYAPRRIHSLKVIECNDIDYSYKYFDRNKLDELFKLKENCDDILIVKNGFVTDTSFANIVFWDGRKWLTPSTPLLKGTTRARLIEGKRIMARKIKLEDLSKFKKVGIINAMNDLENVNAIFDFHI